MLAVFFAGVALLLAGIGLCGGLDYSAVQRRREIGIRMAIGAQAGVALGMASMRYIEALLYEVKPTCSHLPARAKLPQCADG